MMRNIYWSGYGGITFMEKDLKISTGAETEKKENGGEKLTKKKNTGAYEVTVTAMLNAMLDGTLPYYTALALTEAARAGESGYLYWANTQKLITPNMMLTKAAIGNILSTPTGTWLSCEVSLSFEQCSKYGGGSSSGGGGGGGRRGSVRTKTPATKDPQNAVNTVVNNLKQGATSALNTVASAVRSAMQTTSSAKQRALSETKRRRERAKAFGGTSYLMQR